jgi:hypothetical protein
MRNLIQPVIILLLIASCTPQKESGSNINELAIDYVKLALEIGEYDPDFSYAYDGPDSLKFTGVILDTFPKEYFLNRVSSLKLELDEISTSPESSEEEKLRANWMSSQLTAFDRNIKIWLCGEFGTFDEEAEDLYGVKVPSYDSTYFIASLAELDTVLPGEGTFKERLEALISRFEIPEDKLDTCIKVAIEAARKITHERLDLPKEESITLVGGSVGSIQYQGRYQSLVKINMSHKWDICEVINFVCHECYPGHHVHSVMLKKNLYTSKGWIEISLIDCPTSSPMNLITEGIAVYAIDMAFPGESYDKFAKEVMMPLAGLDTTGADAYFLYNRLRRWKLGYAVIEAARGIVNGTMTEDECTHWVNDFALRGSSELQKVKDWRTWIAVYNTGGDLVKNHIEAQSSSEDDRWETFGKLLSNLVVPKDLVKEE